MSGTVKCAKEADKSEVESASLGMASGKSW